MRHARVLKRAVLVGVATGLLALAGGVAQGETDGGSVTNTDGAAQPAKKGGCSGDPGPRGYPSPDPIS